MPLLITDGNFHKSTINCHAKLINFHTLAIPPGESKDHTCPLPPPSPLSTYTDQNDKEQTVLDVPSSVTVRALRGPVVRWCVSLATVNNTPPARTVCERRVNEVGSESATLIVGHEEKDYDLWAALGLG